MRVLTLLPTKMATMPAEKMSSGVLLSAFAYALMAGKLEKWSME